MSNNPQGFGLPYTEWRPGQYEAVKWAADKQIGLLEAPTGSGKTGIVRALGASRTVVALVQTKFLQDENYMPLGFDPLKGRGNYDCVYPLAPHGTKANHCFFAEQGMNKCPNYPECPYVIARETARNSQRASLNYAYWLYGGDLWPGVDMIACDEAHILPRVVVDWAGIELSEEERKKWQLPTFPMMEQSNIQLRDQKTVESIALYWLVEARIVMMKHYAKLSKDGEKASPETRRKREACETLGKKIKTTIEAMETVNYDWYIRGGPMLDKATGKPKTDKSGHTDRFFIVKPLTARHFFRGYFQKANTQLLLLSATIGNDKVFAHELGIEADYQFLSMPSPFPAASRPIHVLDVPRMGQSSTPQMWDHQADEIARAIKQFPPTWAGLILTTSKKQAIDLVKRLERRGLEDRIICAPMGLGTEDTVKYWQNVMLRNPGAILAAWQLWEGYDGREEKFVIVAKCPWWNMGDEFEVRRASVNNAFARWQAAQTLMQGLGRVRRGRADVDYDTPGEVRKYVAIADAGWNQLQKYLSQEMLSSVVFDAPKK